MSESTTPDDGTAMPAAAPRPQALILRREPKANVERYDGLRAQIAGGRHAS